MSPIQVLLRLVFFHCCLQRALATHFRGVHMWWAPSSDNPSQVDVIYRVAWRRSWRDSTYCDMVTIATGEIIGPAAGFIRCYAGCIDVIGDTLFRCTDYSVSENWSAGIGRHRHNFPGTGAYLVGWEGRGWLDGAHHADDAEWSVRMLIDLKTRSDIGRINSSPYSAVPPVIRVQFGCNRNLTIPVADPDGDVVRCRWAEDVRGECGGVCGAFNNATLHQESCSLTYAASDQQGHYVVAIQIEDFPPGSRDFNLEPFSSVPLQFLVYVYVAPDTDCNAKPEFIPPTPDPDACLALDPGVEHQTVIAVRTKDQYTELLEIETVSSIGMQKSEIGRFIQNPRDYYVNITWTPQANQTGEKIFCFFATDANGVSTDQRCAYLRIGYPHPEAERLAYDTESLRVTITFNQQVSLNPETREIFLYDLDTSDLVFSFVTNEDDVIVADDVLWFVLPGSFADKNDSLFVVIQAGVVLGELRCGAESLEVIDRRLRFNTQGISLTTAAPPTETTQSPGGSTVAPVTGGGDVRDYTWLIVTVSVLVVLFAVAVGVAVAVRKRAAADKGLYARDVRQEEYARSVAAKMTINGGYEPDFNDIDVKFR